MCIRTDIYNHVPHRSLVVIAGRACKKIPMDVPSEWPQTKAEWDGPTGEALRTLLGNCDEFGVTVYPPKHLRFAALQGLAPDAVRVVIVGQDPYCGPKQATGLAFGAGTPDDLPPSLQNIIREARACAADVSALLEAERDPTLNCWKSQGVLLLNTALSVRCKTPGSHSDKGWRKITTAAMREVDEARKSDVVWIQWGSHAQNAFEPKHGGLVLRAAHPSPKSADAGFFGCGHFRACNDYLQKRNMDPIKW